MRAALLETTGVHYSDSTISRRWKTFGFTLKRLRSYSHTRSEARRTRFWTNPPIGPTGIAGVFGVPTYQFVDLDEAGFQLNETDRKVGHALKGHRASAPGWVRWCCCHLSFGLLDNVRARFSRRSR
jgi:hypothetical protein